MGAGTQLLEPSAVAYKDANYQEAGLGAELRLEPGTLILGAGGPNPWLRREAR